MSRCGSWNVALVLLLSGSAGLLASPKSHVSTLAVGLLVPAEPGEALSLRQGATLGIEHANQAPGLKAHLVVRGRPGQWGTEGDEAATLALDDEVAGIITPSAGTAAHQVLQVAGRTRLPVVSLCPDSSITGAGVPWAVRIVPRNDEEARALFTGASTVRRAPLRWAALVPPDRAGREAAHDLKAAALAAASPMGEPIQLPASTHDFKVQVEQVLAARPDAVLLWTEPGAAGDLAHALRQAGFAGWLAGPGRLSSESFLRRAGTAAEGCILPTLALSPRDGASESEFDHEYRSRFSERPDSLAIMAHDAVLLIVRILRNSDPDLSYRKFPLQETISGASGPIRFDKSGNRVVSLTLLVCEGGRFKPLANAGSSREDNKASN
jgi:branched-chain amino acid transport system substrate-binding protein